LALAAPGVGAAPERLDAVSLVARFDVFMRDFGPRPETCTDVPANVSGAVWPARSAPYGFLRIDKAPVRKSRANGRFNMRMTSCSKVRVISQAIQAAKIRGSNVTTNVRKS
jgi:hypothetical protein